MTDLIESPSPALNAVLVLADGRVFFGRGIGAAGTTSGEICFNTAMTGYQEVMTDLSYAGQIVTFTFPHIGNVGTNDYDIEAKKPAACGLILREDISFPSNWRNQMHFDDWLKEYGITGICGIDTRALTRLIRNEGAQSAVICHQKPGNPFDIGALLQQAHDWPSLEGMELAENVSTLARYEWNEGEWHWPDGSEPIQSPKYHVVAIDYGEKLNILRCLAQRECRVTVVPASSSAKDILSLNPDGVFLSNGPGDPAATAEYAVPVLRELLTHKLPVFGICLGHQLLALALGAETEKMHQGHRGANHPVKCEATGKVEITSQNHGFVVRHGSLPDDVEITHSSLFDGTVEGLRVKGKPVFSVQHHPESSPGPHDSKYLFDEFVAMVEKSG